MIDKVKKIVLYIVAPILVVAGFITYLLGKISELQSTAARAEAEKEIAKVLEEKEGKKYEIQVAKAESSSATTDYERVRDQYLNAAKHGPGPDSL